MFPKKLNLTDLFILFLLLIAIIFALYIFIYNFNTPWTHFSDQAQSFIKGRLDLDPLTFDKHDYVIKNGKYYWPEGPFPSMILIPFQIIFGLNFHQGIMQLLLIILLVFFLFKLARLKKFDILSSFYLTIAFLLGSTVSGLILDPKSWFFAQVVAVTTLTWLIFELETSRRWLLIGILETVLIATRPTSGLIFFALILLAQGGRKILYFLLPIFLSIFALMWFNYVRFGNPLDNGYLTNDVGGFISPLRDLGFFSLQHIPTNFYYYFLASVEPVISKTSTNLQFPFIKYNLWGLSFFLVSPFFIYAIKSLKNSSTYIKSLWFVIIISLFIQLTYYTPGWVQFGPRYTADFMPILYLLTLYSLSPPNLSKFQKIIISISCLFNVYLLLTPIIKI